MRLILTSDLHYDVVRSRGPTEDLARTIARTGADMLVFVGDLAAADLAILERTFGLFDTFAGRMLFVPGNHELWTPPGGDSRRRYEVELPDLCRRCGVHYLDDGPFVADGLAVVGSVGWYDYTFRSAAMNIPLRFYQHKVSPGAARLREEYRHLVDGHDDLPPDVGDVCVRWMDGTHVRLAMSDVEFTCARHARLKQHLDAVIERARRIVVALHHVPFFELVPRSAAPSLTFASAFMGSELFGELCLQYPIVTHVYCGHAHQRGVCRKDRLMATCIGSTYTEKHYEVLDV